MAVTVSGLREFTMNLKRLGAEAQDLKDVFAEIAREVEQDAKAIAPQRTVLKKSDKHPPGFLRSKIRGSKYAQNRARITVTGTTYHRYVHFGSIHNPNPVPFMFKAMDLNAATVEHRLLQGINELIDRTF